MAVRLAPLAGMLRARFNGYPSPRGMLRLPPRRFVPWIAGSAALVTAGIVGAVLIAAGGSSAGPAAKGTTRVQRGTVTSTVSAAGSAQPLASRGLNFSASGTITELNVKAGDMVAAGAVLARIDSTEAQQAVDEAATQVENAQAAVTKASSSASSSASTKPTTTNAALGGVGDRFWVVAAMDCGSASPSATSSESPSASASASPSPSASASACVPCGCSSKPTGPSQTGGAGQTGVPGQTGRPGQTGSQGAGQGGGGATRSGAGAGGSGQAGAGAGGAGGAGAGDSLFSAEEQLNNAQLTLKQAQTKLAGTTITAPVAGKILSVGGVLGGTASVSSSGFIVLAGTSDVAVKAQFTEAEVAKLAVGQKVKITLPNRDDGELDGSVLQIDPAGTTSNKLVRYAALVTFDQAPAGLLYGQTANVAVITSSAENVLLVPATAVFDRKGSAGTVTVLSGGRSSRRTVQIGLRGDVSTEVRRGLAEGETVLTAGR